MKTLTASPPPARRGSWDGGPLKGELGWWPIEGGAGMVAH